MKSKNPMHKLISKRIQTTIMFLMVVLFGALTSFAQVTATVGDVTGRPGETATVAVKLSGVEGRSTLPSQQEQASHLLVHPMRVHFQVMRTLLLARTPRMGMSVDFPLARTLPHLEQ
jgi:hypothetical protein